MQTIYLTLYLLTHPATGTTQAQSTYHHQLAQTQGQTLPASLRQISSESQQQLGPRKERGITGSVRAKGCVFHCSTKYTYFLNVWAVLRMRERLLKRATQIWLQLQLLWSGKENRKGHSQSQIDAIKLVNTPHPIKHRISYLLLGF